MYSNYLKPFEDYVKNYDLSNDKIKLKYEHSLRVMELSNKYAKLLNFSEEDIELATLIGLLHDIGRFEQIKVYNSFIDLETVDHADYSVEQLFQKNEIKRFTDRQEWYPIIEFAIKYHNKLELPPVKDDRVLKHARLIRDTDKVDIMKAITGRMQDDGSCISKKVMDSIRNHTLVNREYTITKNDRLANQYGFVFNIYNDIVLDEYKNNFTLFHNSVNGGKVFQEMYEDIIKYINERIDKYDRNRN